MQSLLCVVLQETEVLNLEATFSEIHDVFKLFHFSYFDLDCDSLYSGATVLSLNMKTMDLSALVLYTYQTAKCHKAENTI